MTKPSDEDYYAKVADLRRIYGVFGLAQLIDTSTELVEKAINKQELDKSIRSGVRLYWRKHMQKTCQEKPVPKILTRKGAMVRLIEGETVSKGQCDGGL